MLAMRKQAALYFSWFSLFLKCSSTAMRLSRFSPDCCKAFSTSLGYLLHDSNKKQMPRSIILVTCIICMVTCCCNIVSFRLSFATRLNSPLLYGYQRSFLLLHVLVQCLRVRPAAGIIHIAVLPCMGS